MTSAPNATCGLSEEAEAATDPSSSDTSAAASEVVPKVDGEPEEPRGAPGPGEHQLATVDGDRQHVRERVGRRQFGEGGGRGRQRPIHEAGRASPGHRAWTRPSCRRRGAARGRSRRGRPAARGADAGRSPPNDFPASDRATLGISTTAGAERRSWHERRQPASSSSEVKRSRSAGVGVGAPCDDPHAASSAGAPRTARLFHEDAGGGGGQVQLDRRHRPRRSDRRGGNGWGTTSESLRWSVIGIGAVLPVPRRRACVSRGSRATVGDSCQSSLPSEPRPLAVAASRCKIS